MPRFGDVLAELLRAAGAVYSCIADPATGELIAEAGIAGADGLPAITVLGWGAAAAAGLDVVPGDELDDMMITSRRSYHLVRRAGTAEQPLLVYLRLDRRRSNLAVARRELASSRLASRLGGGPTGRSNMQVRADAPLPRRVAAAPPSPGPPRAPVPRPRPGPPRPPEDVAPASAPLPARSPAGVAAGAIGASRAARVRGGPAAGIPLQLPRREPSAPPPPVEPAVPSGSTDWSRDTRTLRRLLAGLRAMRDK